MRLVRRPQVHVPMFSPPFLLVVVLIYASIFLTILPTICPPQSCVGCLPMFVLCRDSPAAASPRYAFFFYALPNKMLSPLPLYFLRWFYFAFRGPWLARTSSVWLAFLFALMFFEKNPSPPSWITLPRIPHATLFIRGEFPEVY